MGGDRSDGEQKGVLVGSLLDDATWRQREVLGHGTVVDYSFVAVRGVGIRDLAKARPVGHFCIEHDGACLLLCVGYQHQRERYMFAWSLLLHEIQKRTRALQERHALAAHNEVDQKLEVVVEKLAHLHFSAERFGLGPGRRTGRGEGTRAKCLLGSRGEEVVDTHLSSGCWIGYPRWQRQIQQLQLHAPDNLHHLDFKRYDARRIAVARCKSSAVCQGPACDGG
mmetsp:Transcript_29512/g.57552  ORF Transcript_29512/g.57552 Transcript_29512/m.57552 type:complete len:224 (-) Transcript_29512:1052-1723(-)